MLKDLLRYKVNAVTVGAVLLAVFLVFLSVAFAINRSFTLTFWDKGYQLKADFTDADGIANASDVRISGVYVGQITDIRSVPGGLAEITFRLDKEHSPMPKGTRANLRLQTLLGQKFIELVPGPGNSSTLDDGSVIPSNATTSPVDFDQWLGSFDKPTRDALSKLIQEGGIATDGRGQDINALLADLDQLSVQSGPDLQTFADRSDHVNNILVSAADVTQNLSDNRQHLANVLTNFNAILGTIAANDPGFRKFIHEGNLSLGHGLTQFTGETQNFNDTIRLLRPTLDKVNPELADVVAVDRTFQTFTNLAQQFSSNIVADVSAYNQNPSNTSCNDAGQAVGCGGPFVNQPSVLVQNPANTTNCEQTSPPASCGVSAFSAANSQAGSSLLPSLLPSLIPNLGGGSGGSPLGSLGGLVPGLLGSPSSNTQSAPSSSPSPDAVTGLLNFLLGH
ncbi:MAG TPA: MlaD family protein [Candidatus Solibacter sp.]|jgi:phospholipid/cholesterol/gamma-HCH transport system substrate-binding protein|nr:MlaD family protein [Candidatus Solibacter sp.]